MINQVFRNVTSFENVVLFSCLLLSGISYSILLLTARLFITDDLPGIVTFQSTAVFMTFILQAGYRAGVRKEYIYGNTRVALQTVYALAYLFGRVIPPVSLLLLLLLDEPLFLAFSAMQALLTSYLALCVISGDKKQSIFISFSIFFHIVIAGITFFIFSHDTAVIIIESISTLLLVFIAKFSSKRKHGERICKLVMVVVMKKYLSLQYAAFLIYFSMFIIAQICLKHKDFNVLETSLLLIYTDMQLLSGVILLGLGKVSVMLERPIIKRNLVQIYLRILALFICLIAIICYIVVYYYQSSSLLAFSYALLFLTLSGRYLISSIFSFTIEACHYVMLFIVGALTVYFCFLWSAEQFELEYFLINQWLIGLALLFLLSFNKSNMFISAPGKSLRKISKEQAR